MCGIRPEVKHVHLNRVDELGLLLRSVNQFALNLHSLVDDVSTQVNGITNVTISWRKTMSI